MHQVGADATQGVGELLGAVDETWQSLKDTFSLSVLANPIEASKGDGEMATGAMGVMGEKFARAVDYCIEHKLPFIVISKSGGARMMESAFSLMQLAKTSGKLSQLSDAGLPYVSILTEDRKSVV